MTVSRIFSFAAAYLLSVVAVAQHQPEVNIVPVDSGWAKNSINAVVFRKNSIASWKDTQYISFYDENGYVVIGKRRLKESRWKTHRTIFQGNINDAHNSISIAVDGNGFLHLSWDHHNTTLKYARSLAPGSMEFSTMPMTGIDEQRVTYPEFFRRPNGSLVFLYRSGQSGEGKLVVNEYDLQSKQWKNLHANLIDGEGQRNAYWQSCIDKSGTLHVSWVWRESPDVASNHDMCYARSKDGGRTWTKSDGTQYAIPITAASAEYVARISQRSELINQTSMTTDRNGYPFIASYWKAAPSQVPQYHIIYENETGWKQIDLNFRKTDFSLSGTGTKSIPISRPQILVSQKGQHHIYLIFRDAELNNNVCVAHVTPSGEQQLLTLSRHDMGSWEPSFDTDLWMSKGILHLFMQRVSQSDGEGMTNASAEPVNVLEWRP